MRPPFFQQLYFFTFVRITFGTDNVARLKQWIRYNKELIKITARGRYLLHCKRSKLIPKHLNKYNDRRLSFCCDSSSLKARNYCNSFNLKILNLEITDSFKHRRSLITSIHWLTRNIENNLPRHLALNFFNSQHQSFRSLYLHEQNRFAKKHAWLQHNADYLSYHHNSMTNQRIKKIRYFCSNTGINSINDIKLSFDSSHHTPNVQTFSIELDPADHQYATKTLFEPREKWFVNTSKTHIPDHVKGFLQLGEGFSLPPIDSNNLIIEYIKHIENNLSKFQRHNFTSMFRSQVCSFVNNINYIDKHRTDTDRKIIDALYATKTFINDNPDIIFTRADKGNTVVALDRTDYKYKMDLSLSDTTTYSILKRNPANSLLKNLKSILKRWGNSKYLPSNKLFFLNSSNAVLPRAYGLPKIHKPGFPLRIIISSIDSPLHNLAEFLQNILNQSLPTALSHLRNGSDLTKKLVNFRFSDDSSLVSLDVVSLFTNVPVDMVLDILNDNWQHILTHTSIPKTEFITTTKFVLESTFFQFDQKYYKQTFGVPMGSPLSPVVADLVMQRLEHNVIGSLEVKPFFYHRYVDDIILAAPNSCLPDLLEAFNSFHHRLSFTMEVGGDRLDFLDLTLIRDNDRLISNWYTKPTFSGRFLNFHSQHPLTHKRGTIISLVDRVLLSSHPSYHKENLDLIIKILLDNGYPLHLIFSSIKRRLFHRLNHNLNLHNKRDDSKPTSFFTIPYVASIADKFIKYFKNISFTKLAFSCYKKLNKFIKVHKDPLPYFARSNVVYKIHCSNCESTYVGQTKRSLCTRVNEHRCHIKRNSTQPSVITDHRIATNHEFDWDGVEILDTEKNYKKRLISEMIHIKKQKLGLNSQSDTDLLNPIYNDIIRV